MEELQAKMKEQKGVDELFVLACARGLLDNAETLLGQGANVDIADRNARRAVHFAAFKGELAVLQLLANKGADLDAEDVDGLSAVQYAALGDHEACVKLLAEKGCWVDSFDKHENTALHLAARHGASAAAARLLKLGAKRKLVNQRQLTPLGEAVVAGNTKLCQILAGDDEAAEIAAQRPRGYGLLHVAAGCGEPLSVKWLLDKGADPLDAGNEEGLTPLHCAVLGGNLIVVEQLIAAGADVGARNCEGATPADLVERVVPPAGMPQAGEMIAKALRAAARSSGKKAPPATGKAADTSSSPAGGLASTSTDRGGGAGAVDGSGRTAAERLASASTPQAVADVMAHLPRDHQLLRLNKWVALDDSALEALPTLTSGAKHRIAQVKKLTQLIARTNATKALRKDSYFQADMHSNSIRASVDAVIADPNLVLKCVEQAEVMACLDKMRALRDVFKANGGGPINLSEILEPWAAADEQRATAMAGALDSAITSALEAICHPSTAPDAPRATNPAVAQQLKDSLDGVAASPPLEESTAAKADEDDSAPVEPLWKTMLVSTAKQMLQTTAIMLFMLFIMWYQGTLPWQRNDDSGPTPSAGHPGPASTSTPHPDAEL